MDLSTIYTKTGRGTRAQIKKLPPNAGQILSVMGAKSSGGDIFDKLKKVNGQEFEIALTWLLEGGFIKVVIQDAFSDSMWAPVTQSSIAVSEISIDEFNQTTEARERAEAEAKEKAELEARERAELETREKAAAEAKEDTEIKAKLGVLARAEEEARKHAEEKEIAERVAEQEAEAKAQAELEAKQQAGEAAKAELEARERAVVEAREKAENDAKAQLGAKAKEVADVKAKLEALTRADEEARERAEAQLKVINEAKEKAETAAIAQAELEAQEKLKAAEFAEAEAKKLAEAEAKKQAEEAAKAEQAARALAKAQAKAEAEAKKKAEAEAKALAKAEAKALARAELLAKSEARKKAKEEADAKEKAEAEARAQAELEAKQKAEAAAKAEQAAREHAEALAKAEAEAKEKAEAEARAQAELEAKQKAEAAVRAKARAETSAKRKAEFTAKINAFKGGVSAIVLGASQSLGAKIEALDKPIDLPDAKKVKKQALLPAYAIAKTIVTKLTKYALLLLILLIVAAQFINLSLLINPIERIAKENIGEEVNIEAVHASIIPAPHLLLKKVSVGDSTLVKAKNVRIFTDASTMYAFIRGSSQTPYQINTIEVEGLDISQKNLQRPAAWLETANGLNQLKIKHIIVKNASFHLNELAPITLEADMQVNEQGQLNNATFTADDKHLMVDVHRADNHYNLDIKAQQWRVPLAPNLVLTTLNAKGLVENKILTLSPISGILYGGQIEATMVADLSDTWSAKGNIALKDINLARMADELKLDAAADGQFKADGNYVFKYNLANNQIEAPVINSRFEIKNGNIKKIDLIEAMRNNNPNIGGTTHFNALSGNLIFNNQNYQFTNLSLQDNQLEAYGRLDVANNGRVNGDIYSKIAIKSNPIKAHLLITGAIDSLKLKNK